MYREQRAAMPEIARVWRVGLLATLTSLSMPVFSQVDLSSDLPIREEPYRRQIAFT
jgi:hypothetical protein